MAYVVLARKYRPQTLAEVIGQDAVVKTLRNAIKLQRLHHAYLFTGARGVGKTSIARIIAKSLNCDKGPTDEPCGVCASCSEIAKSASPDVLEIDGASNTSVDNVRELRETVRYAAQRGRYKIYIIDEVHMLSTNAFNALLKTLEEPPAHVMFVFATTDPQKIPITILSRTQRFDFRRVPTNVLADRVRHVVQQEQLQFDEAAILTVAQAADGSVRDAMSLLDQVIAFAGDKVDAEAARSALGLLDRQKVRAMLDAILRRDRLRVSQLVLEAYQSASDFSEIGERLVEAVRDLTLVALTGPDEATLVGLTKDEARELSAAAGSLSEPDLHRLFNVVMRTVEDTSKSPYPHLTFEMGLMRACDMEPVANLAALVREMRANTTTTITAPSSPRRSSVAPAAPQSVAPQSVAPQSVAPQSVAPQSVAPQSVAPPPVAASSGGSRPSSFREFVARVGEKKPRLAAALEHCSCSSFSIEGIALVISPGQDVFTDILHEPDTHAYFRELTQGLFGRPVTVSVARSNESSQGGMSLYQTKREEARHEVEREKRDTASHPVVTRVLDVLGGQISSVQVAPTLKETMEDLE